MSASFHLFVNKYQADIDPSFRSSQLSFCYVQCQESIGGGDYGNTMDSMYMMH